MSDVEAIRDRLAHIEEVADDRPGEALDELEAVTADLAGSLTDHHDRAHARVRNEDLAGAAHVLNESAMLLQRTATLALAVREGVRRRR